MAFLDAQNITLEYNENIAPALGVSYGGRIALLPGQSKAEEFITLVHEMAHELLHKTERRTMTTATVRETEAEAVAFIVGQAIGLEMGTASSDYIQMYAGNAALLAESLEVIQRTSAVILGALTVETTEEAQLTTRRGGGLGRLCSSPVRRTEPLALSAPDLHSFQPLKRRATMTNQEQPNTAMCPSPHFKNPPPTRAAFLTMRPSRNWPTPFAARAYCRPCSFGLSPTIASNRGRSAPLSRRVHCRGRDCARPHRSSDRCRGP